MGSSNGGDALVEGSEPAALPPTPPSSGQLQMSSFMDDGDHQQQEQQAAPQPGLNAQVADLLVPDKSPETVQEVVRTYEPPPRLYDRCDRHHTQEEQYHNPLRRATGVQFAKLRARAGRQEEAGVDLPGRQRVSRRNMLSIHSDSTGTTKHLSDVHNTQSAVTAGTKR